MTGRMRVLKDEDLMKRGLFLSDEKTRKKGDLHQIVVHFGAFCGKRRVLIILHGLMRIGDMIKVYQRSILGDKRAFSFLIIFQKVVQVDLCKHLFIKISIHMVVVMRCRSGDQIA